LIFEIFFEVKRLLIDCSFPSPRTFANSSPSSQSALPDHHPVSPFLDHISFHVLQPSQLSLKIRAIICDCIIRVRSIDIIRLIISMVRRPLLQRGSCLFKRKIISVSCAFYWICHMSSILNLSYI